MNFAIHLKFTFSYLSSVDKTLAKAQHQICFLKEFIQTVIVQEFMKDECYLNNHLVDNHNLQRKK